MSSFHIEDNPGYPIGVSPLDSLSIGKISTIPSVYMQLVCVAAMEVLHSVWFRSLVANH